MLQRVGSHISFPPNRLLPTPSYFGCFSKRMLLVGQLLFVENDLLRPHWQCQMGHEVTSAFISGYLLLRFLRGAELRTRSTEEQNRPQVFPRHTEKHC